MYIYISKLLSTRKLNFMYGAFYSQICATLTYLELKNPNVFTTLIYSVIKAHSELC